MSSQHALVTERRGPVLILRINRPAVRNALNTEVIAAIGCGLLDADEDPNIRAIVLTGTGRRAFCSGMDLVEFAASRHTPSEDDQPGIARFKAFMRYGHCDVPVIGAANASALAGGFELLLACDLVVAADDAEFGLPEVKRGLFAAGGGFLLAQRIPLAKALELTLTGEPFSAAEAAHWGLVNKVVPGDQVLEEATALAERIAANSPLGVQVSKELVRMAGTAAADELWTVLAERKAAVFASVDAKEGSLAFMQKRDPVWTGG